MLAEETIGMKNSKNDVGAIPRTEGELREENRRDQEKQERIAAMLRMEQMDRVAGTSTELRSYSEDDERHFRAQMTNLEKQMNALPHLNTALLPENTQRLESDRFNSALHSAEQAELRSEKISAQ
jgi:hypothetical protein